MVYLTKVADSPNRVGQADALEQVEDILRQEIDLARPDDLAFLEFQVPRIAQRIVRLLQETEVEITPQMVDEGAAHQVRAKICA